MSEPTLESIFGANATQTTTTITITKADLPGLTPSATNTAESLLVGILLKSQATLIKTNFDTNLDQNIYIETGYPGFSYRGPNNESFKTDQFKINLAKLYTSSAINPNDY